MGVASSKHKKRAKRRGPKKQMRDVITQVGTIDLADDESLFTSDRRPPPFFHHLLASSLATDSFAKEMVPVASLSQPMGLQVGDCVADSDRSHSLSSSLRTQGDSDWETRQREATGVKWTHSITYQLQMKVIDSPLVRLLFMELYGLDLRQMSEEQFAQWARMAQLPRTAHMYQTFLSDANSYAIPRNLVTLENRFNVRVTLGDCVPFSKNQAIRKPGDITKREFTRNLIFYGEGPHRINAAANYLGAILNQLKADQLLLPNNQKFSMLEETNLLPWIAPRPPDAIEPILVRLRKQALTDISEDATTCSSQY